MLKVDPSSPMKFTSTAAALARMKMNCCCILFLGDMREEMRSGAPARHRCRERGQ